MYLHTKVSCCYNGSSWVQELILKEVKKTSKMIMVGIRDDNAIEDKPFICFLAEIIQNFQKVLAMLLGLVACVTQEKLCRSCRP